MIEDYREKAKRTAKALIAEMKAKGLKDPLDLLAEGWCLAFDRTINPPGKPSFDSIIESHCRVFNRNKVWLENEVTKLQLTWTEK